MTALIASGVLVAAALLSAGAVWVSIRVAHRVGALDHPDGWRKEQTLPIPRLGGVAVALTFAVGVLAVFLALGRVDDALRAASVLFPALIAAGVGYWDDRGGLNPYLRLALQFLIGVFAVYLGTTISVIGIWWVDGLLAVLWIMVLVNGVNLLDNTDGLAGSTVLVASIGATVIALIYGQNLVSLMGAALAGVSIGFLVYNWHPARVYLGDAGTYFLGVLLAILIIRLRPFEVPVWTGALIAILLVFLPLMDTSYVVASRIRRGVHPFTPGRDHLSHWIQLRGVSVPASVGILQIVQVAAVVVAVLLALR